MRALIGFCCKILAGLIVMLPIRMQLFLGDVIGILWFDVFRIRRKVALENLQIAFPEKAIAEKTQIARASLRHLGRTLVEFALFPYIDDRMLKRRFRIEGEEHLINALQGGKGGIMLTMHVGNGDLATAFLSKKGYPMNLISKEFKARWLNDMWFGMRSKVGTKFISPEKSSFEILRALKRNEMVIFVLDQFMGPPIGVRTLFFGRETGTAMGCALMAGRTQVPVIPCYTYREPDGTCATIFEAPIPYLDDGPREKNIAVMTQIYTDKIESIVRKHPEQWMWIHRRWKDFRD